MSGDLRPYREGDLEILRGIVQDPSLADEMEKAQGPNGLERALADPFRHPPAEHLAFADGAPAGFSSAFVIPGARRRWAVVRIGVVASRRRRGLGTALLDASLAALRRGAPDLDDVCLTAWIPSECAAGFAARHGFRHERSFWLMERAAGEVAAPVWPEGIEVRPFDGSEGVLEDLASVHSRAFAEDLRALGSTVEATRRIVAPPGADPGGILLAYRAGRCVGFCRDDVFATRGEIGLLAVDPEAQGIGLGRALLRWGAGWLERRGSPRITLIVEHENESALGLYRSEGFAVVRTRALWVRTPGASGGGS